MKQFTETQAAKICWMAGNGYGAKAIAQDVGIDASEYDVRQMIEHLDLPRLSDRLDGQYFVVFLDRNLWAAMEDSAISRNITRVALANRILETVIASSIIGPVLDDGLA